MSSKETIAGHLEKAIEIGITDFLLISGAPADMWIHGIPRFLMILKGKVEVKTFHNNRLERQTFGSGSAFYCGKDGYLFTSGIAPSECISLSFYTNYIRAININFDGNRQPPTELDTFHHTELPLSETGNMIINILDNIAAGNTCDNIASKMLESLLMVSFEEIKKQESGRLNPSSYLWRELDHYIRSNPDKNINRNALAKKFHISPGYISHLFKKFTGKDFLSAITSYKLEYASRLLLETNLQVEEISDKCAFNYTSYFIRCFKKHYGITPHVFRDRNIQKT